MKSSPTRILLVLVLVFLGCFGVAYAAAGMLTALPAPAIGGTCGPSTASETALEALAEPSSIGAGPQPPASNATAHNQWVTFIQQCQSLADRRGLASLAIFVISVVAAGIGLMWVLRRKQIDPDDVTTGGRDAPAYSPPDLHDRAALVGAGAVVGGGAAPMATWPPSPPPGYGPPPAYPGQPVPPPYPGTYPEAAYPQQAWPAQPAGYPPPPGYSPPPAYPGPQGPMAPPAPPVAPPAPPTIGHDGQPAAPED
jgi:hypothetical protein